MLVNRLTEQLELQKQNYKLNKRACFDLIEVFSELNGVDEETFKAQCGLDQSDFEDEEIQALLEIYNEVKHGLEMDDEEGEEELEEEYLDGKDQDDQDAY